MHKPSHQMCVCVTVRMCVHEGGQQIMRTAAVRPSDSLLAVTRLLPTLPIITLSTHLPDGGSLPRTDDAFANFRSHLVGSRW